MASRRQPTKLKTAQIGRCGELLVQLRLLMLGVESAPMATDAGVDLVAYGPNGAAATIQVKTNLRPKPAGGRGKATLDWRVADDSPAQLVALVDLQSARVWLFALSEFRKFAQQNNAGSAHLYMVVDPAYQPIKQGRVTRDFEFGGYLLEYRAPALFGV